MCITNSILSPIKLVSSDRTGPGFFEGGPTGHPTGPGFFDGEPTGHRTVPGFLGGRGETGQTGPGDRGHPMASPVHSSTILH